MLRSLLLLLPALVPSWRFFRTVAPSPRLEVALIAGETDTPADWHPARPRPEHVSLATMLRRLFWNPDRNEALYLVSLCERLDEQDSAHAAVDLARRLREGLDDPGTARFLVYRLVFVLRDGDTIRREVRHQSPPVPL